MTDKEPMDEKEALEIVDAVEHNHQKACLMLALGKMRTVDYRIAKALLRGLALGRKEREAINLWHDPKANGHACICTLTEEARETIKQGILAPNRPPNHERYR